MENRTMSGEQTGRLQQHGVGSELFGIFLINLIKTVLTLGIYRFWAKTRVRQYLLNQTSFDGERFEYSGTGKELLMGFLKALLVIAPLVISAVLLSGLLGKQHPALAFVPIFAMYLAFFILMGVGLYSARRYLLSRTRWRGIRFNLTGSPLTFTKKFVGHGFLLVLTLGLYTPFYHNLLLDYQLNNTWFGNQRFSYDGKGSDLFRRFIMCYFLTLPTLGLIWLWYSAAEYRYIAEHTRMGELRFATKLQGGELLKLTLVNLLMLVFTLGLALPWILLRSIRFAFNHLDIQGEPDYALIAQNQAEVPTSGEGLADFFDLAPA